MFVAGCSSFFASKTVATYEMPDGKKITYESAKEQTGLDLKYVLDDQGKVKELHIKVDKAGTQEAVIQAALQQQMQIGKLLEVLIPLAKAAATKGAVQ